MASKKYLVPLNLLNLATDPETASEGDVYYNTASDLIKVYANGSWVPVASEAFSTIAVSGETSVQASLVKDTLTIVEGTNVTITTDPETNSITINSAGDYTSVDSVTYPDYITFDTTPETVPTATGSIFWDSGDGVPATVLNSNVTIGLGQEQVALVKNATGASIAKGKVVYINGAQGQRPTITLSDADAESTSSKTFGLTAEAIADGAEGFVTTFGVLRGVNTDGLTEGAALWLSSTAGGYTTTVPAEPAHSVFLGYVVKANQSSGEIFVNIQNGYELTELHGVTIENNGNLTDNEVLAYDTSSGLWINQTASEAGLAALSGATFTGDIAVNGGDITTTATTASIFNANATTLNIGGAATDVRIGDTGHSGTTTVENNLYVTGNITFGGSSTTLSSTNLEITDPIIFIASNNTADILDIGIFGGYNDGTNKHTGLIRDASDGKWKLFSGITSEPTTTVDFTGATYDTLKIGTLEATSVPTVGTITSGTWNGSVISATYIDTAIARLVSPSFTTPSLGAATATSINGTTIPTSATLLVSSNIGSTVQAYDADLGAIAALAGTSGLLRKTAANTWSLDTVSYAPIDSAALTGIPTAPTATAGSDTTQIATTAFVQAELASANITLDADLEAIAALTGTSGFLIKTAADNWALDTNTYVSSAALGDYAPLDSPTFSGTVDLPSTTSIGSVSGTEIGYLAGVTSSIQSQLNSKPTIDGTGVISDIVIPDTIARVADISDSTTGYIPINTKGVADGVATLDANGVVPAEQLNLTAYAPKDDPIFTGNVVLPSTTQIGDLDSTEFGYLNGVTSSIQTQIDNKLSIATAEGEYLTIADAIVDYQPKDADLTAIAALTGTTGILTKAGADTWTLDTTTYLSVEDAEDPLTGYLLKSAAVTTYAPIAAPTFTGIVVLPSTTSIGTVSSTEIGYLDGVTSSIQTQLNGKEASHDHPYQTQNSSLSSIAALAGTAGFIKFDGGSTYSVDSNTYLVRNQPTVDTAIIAGTTTFSIANAIATTLNIGGAATAITIGSTNANAEMVIRTPKISTNATSVQLLNTTATTVEFAGAATELHVGGTSTASSTFNIGANATASSNQKIVNLATGAASGSSTVINVGTANDGTTNLYGDVVAHGTIEVPTPTADAQAANKSYVDALAAGINIKEQAKYATTSALTVTYTAGSSDTSGGLGEGALITSTTNGAFSPDGTEVVAGERILVKNQTDAKQNGIYVVTDPGDGDSPFVLTRATDFNGESATNGIVKNGDYVFITAGSVNSNASFVVSQGGTSTSPSGAIKFGTDSVVFSQYSGVPGNITSLGVVTQGVWNSTRIEKEYLDTELATLANPTFTGTVTVPAPVTNTDAATKKYVDDSILANAAALPDIIPLDDIRGQFNGIDSRFQPTFQGETLSILNPLRLLLTVNGIIQTVDFPEYVWQSFLPREGFMVDSDGYIAFSEVPPAGSTFDARLMPGPNINSVKKGYPFRPVDILLGV
jgi:hypothetical protein